MCECIARTDAFLAQHNSKIMLPLFGPQLPFVQTMKVDEKKRGKPAMMFASHCPFCGEKFPETKSEAA
jgi:hypothetical protein